AARVFELSETPATSAAEYQMKIFRALQQVGICGTRVVCGELGAGMFNGINYRKDWALFEISKDWEAKNTFRMTMNTVERLLDPDLQPLITDIAVEGLHRGEKVFKFGSKTGMTAGFVAESEVFCYYKRSM